MMKFTVLKPVYFPDGFMRGFLGGEIHAFGVELKEVGVIQASSMAKAMEKAKLSYMAPILSPILP